MKLKCYLYPSWQPHIRPASQKKDWMDNAPESFAYRCLPLGIANSHGWEILSPCGFEAVWNGGQAAEDVTIKIDPGSDPQKAPVALFGLGTITFHVEGIFQTEPGWNLWLSGPPNTFKDALNPLSGLIETDWSPYTFTMNWQFTRPNQTIRFEKGEPFCFFFPVQRNMIESVEPEFHSIEDNQMLRNEFESWSLSRNSFQENIKKAPPQTASEKWQKLYYRGLCPNGNSKITDHKSKLRVKEFKK